MLLCSTCLIVTGSGLVRQPIVAPSTPQELHQYPSESWLQRTVRSYYLHLPHFHTAVGGIGGWEGAPEPDICSALAPGTSSGTWVMAPMECQDMIRRRAWGIAHCMELVWMLVLVYTLLRLCCACAGNPVALLRLLRRSCRKRSLPVRKLRSRRQRMLRRHVVVHSDSSVESDSDVVKY